VGGGAIGPDGGLGCAESGRAGILAGLGCGGPWPGGGEADCREPVRPACPLAVPPGEPAVLPRRAG
jgi:hypothetical protein